MVKKALVTWALIFPLFVFSQDFTASVDRNKVSFGESVSLSLKLANTNSKNPPLTESLNENFVIHQKRQSSNTTIINGKVTTSFIWNYILMPKRVGDLTIPSLQIETPSGVLKSQPITIHVSKRTTRSDSASSDQGLILTTSVQKADPFPLEPIVYLIKIVSKTDLANLRMGNIEVEDALVERIGEPEVAEQFIDGTRRKVIEIKFLVTPMKKGVLKIPSMAIQGAIPIKNRNHRLFRSFFDNNFDPFSMMGAMELKPFVLMTDEISLNVQAPVQEVSPWLPATSFNIEEILEDKQVLKVGEPITREFKFFSSGVLGTTLPNLKDLQNLNDQVFKIYADSPKILDDKSGDTVKSEKVEKYTLIPQKAGIWNFPEIVVPWFDVSKRQVRYAKIPERQVEVLPAQVVRENDRSQNALPPSLTVDNEIHQQKPLFLYAVIGALFILLLLAFFWGYSLKRKIGHLKGEIPEKGKKRVTLSTKDLANVNSAKEMLAFLQMYASLRWNCPKNTTLKMLFNVIRERTPSRMAETIKTIEKELEQALYQNQEIDMDCLIDEMNTVLKSFSASKPLVEKPADTLPELNPS